MSTDVPQPPPPPNPGRFDVHSHLLPEIDDGCTSLADSIRCARRLVEAGYTRGFCTPHFWNSYPENTPEAISRWTKELQYHFDTAGVKYQVFPGGEIALRKDLMKIPIEQLPTYGMRRKYILIDLWAEKLPQFFDPTIRWMQEAGLSVVLAHPERMRAVQDEPELADHFADLGVLLQGNLQCFADQPTAPTRITAERFLAENRYFMLGSDLHNSETLEHRMRGLSRVIELAGHEKLDRLTIENPAKLLL